MCVYVKCGVWHAGVRCADFCPLQKNLDAELKENDAEQERLGGSTLVYGDTIQVCKYCMYSRALW